MRKAVSPRQALTPFLTSCSHPCSSISSEYWRNEDTRTHLVVIHHCVHGLDPNGINVPVENHPLVGLVFVETLLQVTQTG